MFTTRTLTVIATVLMILVASCSKDAPAQDVRGLVDRLRAGETEFLKTYDIATIDSENGYTFGRALEAQGMRESARVVYNAVLARRGVDGTTGALIAARVARIAAEAGEWDAARSAAALGLEYDSRLSDLWYQYGRALYQTEEYRELREWTAEVPIDTQLAWEDWSPDRLEAEVLLWNAVATIELFDTDTEEIEQLFTRLPADEVHRRVYLYLYYENELSRFERADSLMIEGVYRTSVGEYSEALRLFSLIDESTFVQRAFLPDSDGEGLYRTVERAISGARTVDDAWLDRLERVLENDFGTDGDAVSIGKARLALLRAAGSGGGEGIDRLIAVTALLGDRDSALTDRLAARRRALSIETEIPIEVAIDHARALGEDAEAYDAIVEAMLPAIVRTREWERLAAIRTMLPEEADRTRASIALVLAEADEWSRRGDGDLTDALAPLVALPVTDYYGLVARRMLGLAVESQDGTAASRIAPASESSMPTIHGVAALEWTLARFLFDAGLIDDSYTIAMRRALDADEAPEALELAFLYREYGYVSHALGLARRAAVRGYLVPDETMIELLYPRPYTGEFEAIATRFDIDEALLYALVREESHFVRTARSPVGAEGLAQLMPTTAEDMRRRLGLAQLDVLDPTDSLTLGAYYLSYLGGEIEEPVLQVAAYNAGLGRGRRWMESFGDLSPLLQIEAIPFRETRWYLKKIAVSTALYGRLLYEIDPVRGLDILLTGGAR